MKWIIDRIEGEKAVIESENGQHFDLPLTLLPEGTGEGDVIALTLDPEEKNARKEKLAKLRSKLFVD